MHYGPQDDLSGQTISQTEDTAYDGCKSMVNTAIVSNGFGVKINCADSTTTLNGVALWAG